MSILSFVANVQANRRGTFGYVGLNKEVYVEKQGGQKNNNKEKERERGTAF